MRKKEPELIITFHTTVETIAMEKLCRENQKTRRMIPVPREMSTDCGLTWCCEPDMEQKISEFTKGEGTEHEETVWLMYRFLGVCQQVPCLMYECWTDTGL